MVQGFTLVVVAFVVINLLTDILYGVLDPKVRVADVAIEEIPSGKGRSSRPPRPPGAGPVARRHAETFRKRSARLGR